MEERKIGKWKMRIGSSRRIALNCIELIEEFLNLEWRQAAIEGIAQPWWSREFLVLL